MKIGTKVVMVDCLEAEAYRSRTWIIRSEPWDVCGSMVVLLEGYRGGFAVDCLRVVD